MKLNLTDIEQAAQAAAPYCDRGLTVTQSEFTTRGFPVVVNGPADDDASSRVAAIDVLIGSHDIATFIATANPTAVLAMVARIRELETDGKDLVRMLERISLALNEIGWPSSPLGVEDRVLSAIRALAARSNREFRDTIRRGVRDVLDRDRWACGSLESAHERKLLENDIVNAVDEQREETSP